MNCTPKVRQKTFGVQFNLMGSPFSIPDVAYDYSSLVNDLNGNYDIEEVMKRAAIRTMNLWNEYYLRSNRGDQNLRPFHVLECHT